MKPQPTSLFRVGTIIVVCAAALLSSLFRSSSGLNLRFDHGEMVAGPETELEVTLRVTDEQVHEGVKLTWRLPPWVEVVKADPALSHAMVDFGRLMPGDRRTSKLVVRIRNLSGTTLPIGYSVREETSRGERYVSGENVFTIPSSALTATGFSSQTVEAGSSVPIVIQNTGASPVPAVILRLLDQAPASSVSFQDNDAYRVGELGPGERRTVYLDVDPKMRGPVDVAWELQDAARALDRGEARFHVVAPSALTSTPTTTKTSPNVQTTIQYLTPSGDQLGVGPNPPRVGETTTYWVTWSVTSTSARLADLVIRGTLASDVRATGRHASMIPGTFKKTASTVTWSIPSLPVTQGDAARFSFEVTVTPTSTERGEDVMLIESTDVFYSF
jgi:hypothetical protein